MKVFEPFTPLLKKQKETKLSEAIFALLREDGLETPLNEYRAQQAWPEVMGELISRYTTNVTVRGGIMYVQVSNAALRQELMMNRSNIISRINQHVKAQVIQQVVVR